MSSANRKSKVIVIEDDGRDKGKMFIVNEMSTGQAEEWALKAFLALSKSGVDIPDNISEQGFAGIAMLGLRALGQMNFYDAKPLLDEMFEMIQIVPDPKNPKIKRGYDCVGDLVDDDIEEVMTRLKLRKEILQLHTNVFTTASP